MNCENVEWNTDKQSDIYINGVREDSWGLVQINLFYNPDITKEQATDPDFAINFLAKKLSIKQGYLWTCYRDIFM